MGEEFQFPFDVKKVLFVCTGNSCRSVMAKWFFEKIQAESELNIEADSAGVSAAAGWSASQETLDVLKNEGIDASSHRSQGVTEEMMKTSDIVCVMTDQHYSHLLRLFPGYESKVCLLTHFSKSNGAMQSIGIPDPIGSGQSVYNETFELIKASVLKLIDRLK